MEILFVSIAGLLTIGLSIFSIIKSNRQDIKLGENKKLILKNIIVEIILISVVGFISIGLSISSILKSNTNEIKLNNATNRIIQLQDTLYEQAIRLNNPIPESFEIIFSSSLELNSFELDQIDDIVNPKLKKQGNYLPFDNLRTNESYEKINRFKDISIRLQITLHNGEKILTIDFNRGPLNLVGYNSPETGNDFRLYYQRNPSAVKFDGFTLLTTEISANYSSPSFKDFENSKAYISYSFAYPILVKVGAISSKMYEIRDRDYIKLNFESVHLLTKNFTINISEMKNVKEKVFTGKLNIIYR